MIQRIKLQAVALLVLGVCCALYQFTFVAWLEPPPLPKLNFASAPAMRPNKSLAHLFPPGSWQLGNCKRLQTRDGALLFENWTQLGDDQWKLWPLTVVLGAGSDSPLILDAVEGAEIKFSESLDVMSGGAPPIERGRMIGQVRIRSVGKGFSLNPDDDGPIPQAPSHLEIVSSDFGIDYRKIWTTQPISVRLGGLRIEGRDLTLHLAPMGKIMPGSDSAMSILNRMELIYLDEMTVPLPFGGLWRSSRKPLATAVDQQASQGNGPNQPPGQTAPSGNAPGQNAFGQPSRIPPPPSAPISPISMRLPGSNVSEPTTTAPHTTDPVTPDSEGEAHAVLRCAGRVEFLFTANELSLTDAVRLEHHVGKTVDVFACDSLKLQFNDLFRNRNPEAKQPDPTADAPATDAPPTANATAASIPADTRDDPAAVRDEIGDYLLSLVAEGQPAMLRLPSFAAEVAAEKINVDVRAGLLMMTGKAGARISYAGNTWRFKQVAYQMNPSDPQQIGAFDAQGSGIVEFAGGPSLPIKRLRWSDGIKLDQTDANGEFTLRVDGKVTALMNDDGEFACDSAMLVLKTGDRKLQGEDWIRATRPLRFQATGHVHLKSSMVDVATRLLRLYFEFDQADGAEGLRNPVQREGGLAEQKPAGDGQRRSLRKWVRQPNPAGNATGQLAANATPIPGPRPTVQGDSISAKLQIDDRELSATDLTVVGNVSLMHTIDTPAGPLPTVLTGEQLQLRDIAGDEILQIGSGLDSPAKLKVGDGYFIGPLIQVRLADNIVWIRDAGEFQVPTQMLPQVVGNRPILQPIGESGPSESPGVAPNLRDTPAKPTNIEWVAAPRCRWRGHMLFDGSRIVLTDGIDVRGAVLVGDEPELWDIDLVADQLQVVMGQSVPMRNLESMGAGNIDRIAILSSPKRPLVITANQLTQAGIRKARHVLTTPELTFRPDNSTLVGTGPGWYRGWMQTDQSPVSSVVTSDGFRPQATSLVGLHLVFRETLQGNINQQNLQFVGEVRVASRPVQDWDDRIDAGQLEGLRLGESTLECDRIMLGLDPAKSRGLITSAWEMEALGRVVFNTRNDKGLFSGAARRAAYTAAKDTFLIEGEPGFGATLSQTLPTGAPGINVAVKRMSVNTRTMEVINVEFERLQLGTLPNSQR
jgi:hypothetical protein